MDEYLTVVDGRLVTRHLMTLPGRSGFFCPLCHWPVPDQSEPALWAYIEALDLHLERCHGRATD